MPSTRVPDRRAHRRVALVAALGVLVASSGARPRGQVTPLPERVEQVYQALASGFREAEAFDVVVFMDRFWRVAGSPGFDASIARLRDGLVEAGYAAGEAADAKAPTVRVEEYVNRTRGWEHTVGTLRLLDGRGGDVLLSRETDRVALCINSFSTPEGGVTAALVDVGGGTADADYQGKDVKGTVVLADGAVGRVWQQAVKQRGALGVVSSAVAAYVRPVRAEQFTRDDQWDVFQWGSIPYDEEARSFAFKAPYRVARRLRDALRRGPAQVHVEVTSTFSDGPVRTLVAEIPGHTRPDERIVAVAHVQEPGANDDASGCGTQYALATALLRGIASGAIPPPARTLTFLWVDEIRGSRQWLADHPEEAAGVQYMFSLDMTGEDVAKTGGSFLVEKQPDPSAVWARPSDPHTEWGAGRVKAETLKGSLLNDLHLVVCARRARDTGWVVKTNPYEGGSDHTVFEQAGVPSLLNWHFTDRYYHTNLDRPDKTSAAEMKNVGVAVGTSAWWLASAYADETRAAAALVAAAADARLALERRQSREIVTAAADRRAAEAREAAVFDAWKRWYAEALDSVRRLPVVPVPPALAEEIDRAIARVRAATR